LKLVFAFAAVVALAMAQSSFSPLSFFCSLQADCLATSDKFKNISCKLTRVRNFARYDFYNENNEVNLSVILRPDLDNVFFYLPQSSYCHKSQCWRLNTMEYRGTDIDNDMFFVTKDGFPHFAITYVSQDRKLVEENITVPEVGRIKMVYSSVNYDYVNEKDDIFSLPSEMNECEGGASKAADGITSLQCGNPRPMVPDYLCSVSGVGTAKCTFPNGETATMRATMMTVNDHYRYDLYVNPQDTVPTYSFLLRDYKYYVHNSVGCMYNDVNTEFEYLDRINGLDTFAWESGMVKRSFHHKTLDLVKDTVDFKYLVATIEYESVNRSFVHTEADDAFSFQGGMCNQNWKPATKANSSLCPKKFTPVLPCAFEFRTYSTDKEVVYRVMMRDFDYGYLNITDSSGDTTLLRCDLAKEGACIIFLPSDGICLEYFSFFREPSIFGEFTYYGEPEDVKCLDGSDGCKKYCLTNTKCIIVDKGRIVNSLDYNLTYTDYIPTADDFKTWNCDGIPDEAPPNLCPVNPSGDSDSNSNSVSYSNTLSSASLGLPSLLVVALLLAFFF